jgi:hypothetical protein
MTQSTVTSKPVPTALAPAEKAAPAAKLPASGDGIPVTGFSPHLAIGESV